MDSRKQYRRDYYLEHRDKFLEQTRAYKEAHPESVQEWGRKYSQKHKAERAVYKQKWDLKNRAKVSEYRKTKRINSPTYRIACNLRRRFHHALKGNNKSISVLALIGCSVEELKRYIESQFQSGMSWANYGEWEIDHIYPCSKFDLSKSEAQQKCFHYTNLQPLWERDNLEKGNKISIKEN